MTVSHPEFASTRLTMQDRSILRTASFRATQVLPPGIGEAIADELRAWEDFGYIFGGHGRIRRIVNEIRKMPPTVSHI